MTSNNVPKNGTLEKTRTERILVVDDGKCFSMDTTEERFDSTSNTQTLKQDTKFCTSNSLFEPLEQILIVDDENVIRLQDTNKFVTAAESTPKNLLPHCLVPRLNCYLLDVCTSAIFYREQIIQLFHQRSHSKFVPKQMQLIGNNGKFKGASLSQIIINNAKINVATYGLFTLFVTLDRNRKQLLISMWQKEQIEWLKPKTDKTYKNENKPEENTKFLCKLLSKTVYNLAKLYHVLDIQNAKEPRPWALSSNQSVSTNDFNISNSKIIHGTLLEKVCNFNDQFTISINFKEYRLGNARFPHKPKISLTIENQI